LPSTEWGGANEAEILHPHPVHITTAPMFPFRTF